MGECLPELPEGGLPAKTTSPRSDLQAISSSLPVENRFGTQVDINYRNATQNKEGQVELKIGINIMLCGKKGNLKMKPKYWDVCQYKVINLSLQEIKLENRRMLG